MDKQSSFKYERNDTEAQVAVSWDESWNRKNFTQENVLKALVAAGASKEAAEAMLAQTMDNIDKEVTARTEAAQKRFDR